MKEKRVFCLAVAIGLVYITACYGCSKIAPASNDLPLKELTGSSVILGRPTDHSVTISALFDNETEVSWEYGADSLNPGHFSATFMAEQNIPFEMVLDDLRPDTRYYYRARFRQGASDGWSREPYFRTFHTMRLPGKEFVFTVESDEHLYDKKGGRGIYKICLDNQAADKPDFMLSLGDIFGDDHYPYDITSEEIDFLHRQYRPFLSRICHSVPLFICLGNHEGENDFFMNQNPPDNLAVRSTLARKKYFPNPFPDSFYSGNDTNEPYGIGRPGNYYSWNWGDALFVVIDVYRYQNSSSGKPKGWDWTIGAGQYDWLKKTLENSRARYKFVFAHHLSGQGRGGANIARYFEWGGFEQDGITYGFPERRPGFEKPIHNLFVENNVSIFFQGHDHVFAREQLDGVTYQTVPMPSDSTYQIGILANGYAFASDVVGGTGHLRVTVSQSGARVDFVKAVLPADENSENINRNVAFSYSIQ